MLYITKSNYRFHHLLTGSESYSLCLFLHAYRVDLRHILVFVMCDISHVTVVDYGLIIWYSCVIYAELASNYETLWIGYREDIVQALHFALPTACPSGFYSAKI